MQYPSVTMIYILQNINQTNKYCISLYNWGGCFVELESDLFLQMKAVSDLIYPMYGINKST